MKNIKYFLQYLSIIFLFIIFKILGLKYSLKISGVIFSTFGPFFRSKIVCKNNLSKVFPKLTKLEQEKIIKSMWTNYGKIFAEYPFIKKYKKSNNDNNIIIENQEYLDKIRNDKDPVIFISGHFNNFELMAMSIENYGIDLAAIYRPLNNVFLNPLMEKLRKKYICKNQIKKGISGTKELLRHFKNGSSIALMIDQRVSQGIECNLFGTKALTTTIPAQFSKKYNAKIVPIYIMRTATNSFKLSVYEPLEFNNSETISSITLKLNKILEEMILINPDQWIWTHNRWK